MNRIYSRTAQVYHLPCFGMGDDFRNNLKKIVKYFLSHYYVWSEGCRYSWVLRKAGYRASPPPTNHIQNWAYSGRGFQSRQSVLGQHRSPNPLSSSLFYVVCGYIYVPSVYWRSRSFGMRSSIRALSFPHHETISFAVPLSTVLSQTSCLSSYPLPRTRTPRQIA